MQAKKNLIFIIVYFVTAMVTLVVVQKVLSGNGVNEETIKTVISYVTLGILLIYLTIRTIIFRRWVRKKEIQL